MVARQAAKLAEQTQQLRELATRDELTGLLNRRGFFEVANDAIDSARAAGHRTAMFFVDLDGLKQINHTQGHLAGDRALTVIANALKEAAAAGDCVIGRIGGDEFCVLHTEARTHGSLDETTIQRAISAAANAHLPGLSATIGRVGANPEDDLAQLISRSDREMYSRKARRGS